MNVGRDSYWLVAWLLHAYSTMNSKPARNKLVLDYGRWTRNASFRLIAKVSRLEGGLDEKTAKEPAIVPLA